MAKPGAVCGPRQNSRRPAGMPAPELILPSCLFLSASLIFLQFPSTHTDSFARQFYPNDLSPLLIMMPNARTQLVKTVRPFNLSHDQAHQPVGLPRGPQHQDTTGRQEAPSARAEICTAPPASTPSHIELENPAPNLHQWPHPRHPPKPACAPRVSSRAVSLAFPAGGSAG